MTRGLTAVVLAAAVSAAALHAQQQPPQFGGSYASLDPRQQHYIDDWISRLSGVTGKKIEAGQFYDQVMRFSTKTTFEAITHALKTTPLTDASGASLGDALDLIEHVDTVRGKAVNAPGDRQFRMYVRLTENAFDTLGRSREFNRVADNTVYHKGYPISFRGASGVPSIQISIALDHRAADVDVDYRSSSFPAALFNGHLTASNSDIRAGNNYAKHTGKWSGLQNWWQSFFGIRLTTSNDPDEGEKIDLRTPRIGKKPVDAMMKDFLDAWLVEGDIQAALGYVSRRALSCMTEEAAVDQGMAPLMLARRLKAAHDAVGRHQSIDELVVGIRLNRPGLKPVNQPHSGQFVVYSVSEDQARAFECDSAEGHKASRNFGATFYIKVPGAPTPVALLWAEDEGFWRIVAWQTDAGDANDTPEATMPSVPAAVKIAADPTLVNAARDFLERWLVRKDYAKAFEYLSPDAYECYDVVRGADQPASTSREDAAQKIRAAIEQVGVQAGKIRNLEEVVSGTSPIHPAVKIMEHRRSSTFALASIPNAMADAANCAARARGQKYSGDVAPEYGRGFVEAVRFRSTGDDGPVLRLLWMKVKDQWKITAYDVDLP